MKHPVLVPHRLKEYEEHLLVPPRPFNAAWDDIPVIVRAGLQTLSGIQPVTTKMVDASGGVLHNKPSSAEVELFREKKTSFQLIKLVLNMAYWHEEDGAIRGAPSSIYAVPAIKRDAIEVFDIDAVERFADILEGRHIEDVLVGFDPFSGKYEMSVLGGSYVHHARGQRPLSQIGFVLERYFLATTYEREDLLEIDDFIPEHSRKGFRRNREKKLYRPFRKWQSRQIWGLDSDIELFMFQELLARGYRPELQWIIYRSGELFQSLYDAYSDIEFRHNVEMLTEADLFFPAERVAVFCDGNKHHKKEKDRQKDALIDAALLEMGITPVRVSGRQIREDLKASGDKVEEALAERHR